MMTIELKKVTVGEITAGYVNNDEQGVRGYGGRLDIRTVKENCQMLCKDCNRRKVAK